MRKRGGKYLNVLIVDDDALIRDGLKLLLEIEDDIEVVGTAKNGQEALDLCKKLKPNLVLMDIRMPVMDGVLSTKLIKDSFNDIKIVILTTFKDDEYIKEAIKNGAEGYILKNQSSDSIIEGLRAVSKGTTVFDKAITTSLSSMLDFNEKKMPLDFGLTEREFQVLSLIGEGMSNKEIANKLFLGEGTVRNYVTTLLEKLEQRDRTQLAIFFIKNF